jgi:hypothetical protein
MRVRRASGPISLLVAGASVIAVALGGACDLSPHPLPPDTLLSNGAGGNGAPSGGGSASGSSGESGSGGEASGAFNVGSSGTSAAAGGAFGQGSGTVTGPASSGASSGAAATSIPLLPEDAAAGDAGVTTPAADAEAGRDGEADAGDAESGSGSDRGGEPRDAKCEWDGLASDATWACE